MARLIGSCCLLFSLSAFAQNPQSQTYGTQDEIVYVAQASSFTPWDSTQTYGGGSGLRWVTSSGGCCLSAPVSLPSGASVIGAEVEACVHSLTAGVTWALNVCGTPDGCSSVLPTGSTAPNVCGRFRQNFTTPVTVNNAVSSYTVQFSGGDYANTLYAMRLFYKLQVSPAPQTARFTDVPTTHPFFQYIEALASAGITAGCSASPPQYCPDAPLTRGQMAVFLARALGLHWVP